MVTVLDAAKTRFPSLSKQLVEFLESSDVMVNDYAPEYSEPPDELVDISVMDGKQLHDDYVARHAKFGTTPFDPEGKRLRLYPGGVTIWSGFPGHGKTTLLRQLICHILKKGSSVFLASLEENPRDVLMRLAGVAAGREVPSPHQMQWFIDAYAKRFRLWGRIGIARNFQMLSVVRKLAAESKIRHVVIDSLMCMDISNDDNEGQRRFANDVAATARACNVHIHLVAHPRKLINSNQEPDLNDVAGAREIGGIADNVIFVRRSQSELDEPTAVMTPMCIAVKKQRHGSGMLGTINGWYHRDLKQFHVEQFPHGPTRYLPEDAYT
jgi:twinkle protein